MSAAEETLNLQMLANVESGRWPGVTIHREFRFHPARRWRFDFAIIEQKIAIEVEGGTWAGGRHTRGAGFEADCEKYNTAAELGWRVFRFTPKMIDDGRAIATLEQVIASTQGENYE